MKNRNIYPYIIIVIAVSFGVYLIDLTCELVVDDRHLVLGNPWITDVKYIWLIVSNSVWSFQGLEGVSNHYRPLYLLFYMATYHIFEYKAYGYHLVNNLFHTLSSVFVFLIALRLLKESLKRETGEIRKNNRLYVAALIAALIFATHPVNTESVVWVAAVSEVSFALFCLISFYLYMTSGGFGTRKYWLSVLFFFIGALSKESSVFLPPLLVCYDLVVKREPVMPFLPWIKRYAPFIAAGFVYLVIRSLSLGGITPMPTTSDLSTGAITLNFFPLVGIYLYKLLLPINLIFLENFRMPVSIGDWRIAATILCLAAIIYLAIRIRSQRSALFALIWIFVPLLPVFQVSLVKGGPALAERYLYISTAGFGMLIMFGFLFLTKKFSGKGAARVITLTLFVLIAAYSIGTYKRSLVWRNELVLWEDTVRKDPTNFAANNNLGIELNRRGRLDESIVHFKRSLEIRPEHHPARNNLGVALAMKGDLSGAEAHFRRVLKEDALNENAKINLEKTLKLLGK